MSTLPIIDLQSPDLGALREAAHEIGFFYLIGHGVPEQLPGQLLASGRDFFSLPEVNKLQIENVHSPHFRGYTRLGSEYTYGAPDQREQLDIGPESRAIPADERRHPWDVLVGPNQWPRQVPALRSLALDYLDRLTAVSLRLLESWATSLGADSRAFSPAPGQQPQPLLKLAHYPGTDLPQGVGQHKDIGTLTLLHLEEGSAGLQAQTVDGDWVRCRGRTWSTSARRWRSPPTATCAPHPTGSSRPDRVRTGCPCPTSTIRRTRPGSSTSTCRRSWRPRPRAPAGT